MRVLIGEDEALLREGLSLVLATEPFDVVATAGDAGELVRLARSLVPDLVITDIRMPPDHTDDGLRAALRIRREQHQISVVVLSQHLQRRYAIELLSASPRGVGYLLKQSIADGATFRRNLIQVAAGGTSLDPEVVALMVAHARHERSGLDRLTPRQLEVMSLMATGRSNAHIARSLNVSERAVTQHVSHIYDELSLPVSDDDHRRVLAVIQYLTT